MNAAMAANTHSELTASAASFKKRIKKSPVFFAGDLLTEYIFFKHRMAYAFFAAGSCMTRSAAAEDCIAQGRASFALRLIKKIPCARHGNIIAL